MVKILAYADFTQDMAVTLQVFFAAYARDGVVRVEITDHGLCFYHAHSGTRQFLGNSFQQPTLLKVPLHRKRPRKQGAP